MLDEPTTIRFVKVIWVEVGKLCSQREVWCPQELSIQSVGKSMHVDEWWYQPGGRLRPDPRQAKVCHALSFIWRVLGSY